MKEIESNIKSICKLNISFTESIQKYEHIRISLLIKKVVLHLAILKKLMRLIKCSSSLCLPQGFNHCILKNFIKTKKAEYCESWICLIVKFHCLYSSTKFLQNFYFSIVYTLYHLEGIVYDISEKGRLTNPLFLIK